MGLLHLLRTELDPVRHVMSEYADGPFGIVMTLAFYAIAMVMLAVARGRDPRWTTFRLRMSLVVRRGRR